MSHTPRYYQPTLAVAQHIGTGVHYIYHFENGYGASVIPEYDDSPDSDYHLVPIPNEYELAVTKLDPATNNYELCYTTKVADDVIRHIHGYPAVSRLLDLIAGLEN